MNKFVMSQNIISFKNGSKYNESSKHKTLGGKARARLPTRCISCSSSWCKSDSCCSSWCKSEQLTAARGASWCALWRHLLLLLLLLLLTRFISRLTPRCVSGDFENVVWLPMARFFWCLTPCSAILTSRLPSSRIRI